MKSNLNQYISDELKERLSKIKMLALDMDGTIYLGSTLFPFTLSFLDSMKAAGIGYSFLTNIHRTFNNLLYFGILCGNIISV